MDNTLYLVSKLKNLSDKFISDSLKKLGIDEMVPSHGRILIELFQNKSLSMSEIAIKIEKDPSTVTTLVKKLINLGYVEISKDIVDKRTNKVILTKKGNDLEHEFKMISSKMYNKQYLNIEKEDILIFRKVLEEMIDNFKIQ